MKKINLTIIGIIIYLVLSIIDRLVDIADYIYVPIALVALVICIIGIIKDKNIKIKERRK